MREFGLTHVILTTGACRGGSEPRLLTPLPLDPLDPLDPVDPVDPVDPEACANLRFRIREAEISAENV